MSRDRERPEPPPRPPEDFRNLFQSGSQAFGLSLEEATISRLGVYLADLDVWRRKVNLTGRLTAEELASHTLESVLGAELIPHGTRVVDIGSGAGFPGLPLAIARPDLSVTLIEPLLRRTTFLSEVVQDLQLSNVRVVRGRAADVSETFDVVTARAVADLGKLAAWCLPLVRSGGVLLALKGESASAEVTTWTQALRDSGAMDIVVASYGDIERPTTVVEVSR